MKQADFKILERALSSLPVERKKYIAERLLGQISSQADTLIDTLSHHFPCPHCGGEHAVKWGRSGGLQRYRCRNPECHKTFNALTGKPLAKLQHRDKWFDYLRCMRGSLTLRASAARVGIDLKTAFRWRHRFLKTSAQDNATPLSGIIEVDETFFLESCKGKRQITHRKPRKRGGQGNVKKKNKNSGTYCARP